MLLCLAEYLIPFLTLLVFGYNNWTTVHQQRFHEICRNLVKAQHLAVSSWKCLCTLREEMPNMFFASLCLATLQVARIGQQMNNLLLTYLIVTFVLMLPGLKHRGIISLYTSMAKRELNRLLTEKVAVRRLLVL